MDASLALHVPKLGLGNEECPNVNPTRKRGPLDTETSMPTAPYAKYYHLNYNRQQLALLIKRWICSSFI